MIYEPWFSILLALCKPSRGLLLWAIHCVSSLVPFLFKNCILGKIGPRKIRMSVVNTINPLLCISCVLIYCQYSEFFLILVNSTFSSYFIGSLCTGTWYLTLTLVHTSAFLSRVLDDTGPNNCHVGGTCMLIFFLDIISLYFSLLAEWHSHLLARQLGDGEVILGCVFGSLDPKPIVLPISSPASRCVSLTLVGAQKTWEKKWLLEW